MLKQSFKQEQPVSPRSRLSKLDFAFAKARSRVSKLAITTQKRGHALRDVIELDSVYYDMFDLPPITEYRRYIVAFGRSNAKQVK